MLSYKFSALLKQKKTNWQFDVRRWILHVSKCEPRWSWTFLGPGLAFKVHGFYLFFIFSYCVSPYFFKYVRKSFHSIASCFLIFSVFLPSVFFKNYPGIGARTRSSQAVSLVSNFSRALNFHDFDGICWKFLCFPWMAQWVGQQGSETIITDSNPSIYLELLNLTIRFWLDCFFLLLSILLYLLAFSQCFVK